MATIHFITGGQRSGKSSYAQKQVLSLSENPVYLATSRVWDNEHHDRIKRHQADRGEQWENIEEEKYLSKHNFNGKVVMLDCITLWLTNFFFDNKSDIDKSLQEAKEEFHKLIKQDCQLVVVSNEIGLGGQSTNEIQRKFTDLQGWFNQYVAGLANEVTFMVSGLPMKVK